LKMELWLTAVILGQEERFVPTNSSGHDRVDNDELRRTAGTSGFSLLGLSCCGVYVNGVPRFSTCFFKMSQSEPSRIFVELPRSLAFFTFSSSFLALCQ